MISQFLVFTNSAASDVGLQTGEEFAAECSLETITNLESLKPHQAAFECKHDKLVLHLVLEEKPTELSFDFAEGEVGFRAARVSKSNEVVAKAIGCKPHYRPKVLDATAGMGRDALIMAALGCNVVMQERNFAIYHLLKSALENFLSTQEYQQLPGQLFLRHQDSCLTLSDVESVEVIYLDPMFPERKKSALVKKEMRLFKLLAGEDEDADELFNAAINSNVKRVVVKRPKGAPFLAGKKPSHEIKAKKFRYDVYLVNQ